LQYLPAMPITGLHGKYETSDVFEVSVAHVSHLVEYLGNYAVDDDNVWGVTYRNYEEVVKSFLDWLKDVLTDKGTE
jgi:hypothetical protein